MSAFKLIRICLLEVDESTGIREKEHFAYSFFEADRLIEQINTTLVPPSQRIIQFRVEYDEGGQSRSYKGVFRYQEKSKSLSLQRHIQEFLQKCESRCEQMNMTQADFSLLCSRMKGLFEACSLEEMFKINHKPVYQAG